ncbi:carbohydrate ABC transporter permease [Eubacteriales bacterium OttesenSCG-928-N14]|nr:carbohydrate ABC transporter permease [Eubacteriales bacterium OttesenSCG-928-N14]
MRNEKKKRKLLNIITPIAAISIGLIIVFPLLYGVFGAFKTPAEFSQYPPTVFPESFLNFANFERALSLMPFWRYMLNSLIIASMSSTVRITFAVLAAYSFTFYEFRGKNFLFFLLLATMMFPGDTLLVTNYLTVTKLGLLDTYLAVCITSFVGASQMFMLRQNFRTIPKDLRAAAELDGCGDFKFMTSVLLPIAKPVVITLLVQSFITSWNSYLWPLLVTNSANMRTVQVGVSMLTSTEDVNYYLVLAGVTLTLLPSLVLFAILRRNINKGMTAGALVG